MLRKPLLVQQEIDGRIVKTKLLKQAKRPFIIGSSRKADMRILDEAIDGVHTALEYRHPHWYVIHMDPSSDTPEVRIDKNSEIKIAGQKFKIFVGEETKKIYDEEVINQNKEYNAHHVVVFAGQNIVTSQYLPVSQPYGLNLGTEMKVLAAPTSSEWVVTELGKFTIRQRLTNKPNKLKNPSMTMDALLDPETRNGLLVAGLFTLILALGINLMPEKKLEEKKEDNQFVKMIFDQKVVKKLQQEAKQAQSQQFNEAPKQKVDTNPVPKQQLAQKVVKDIKNVGISNLVAKISKRASANAIHIESIGKTADDPNTGSALARIGSQKVAGKVDATGSAHSIGGVKTDGKAGGSGTYSKGTSLAGAGVGSGTVDILEEETYVDGGLDKEIIAEYIKSKLGQIRYCYERQLSGNPNLHGTVLIKFTIGGNGNVANQSVARTTLKDANVEECILRRVAGWNFPLPKGGTSVVVSYPFLFKSIN